MQIYEKEVKLNSKKTSATRHDKPNRVFKINNEMKLTFVLVYRKDEFFAGSINYYVVIFNNGVV